MKVVYTVAGSRSLLGRIASIGRNMLTAYEWLLGKADKPEFALVE